MRMTKKKETKKTEKNPTTMEAKIEKQMGSSNIKTKGFKTLELENYEMSQSDIELILEYQKKLPVLQEDNENFINARDLHNQLGVRTKFADWIKGRINKYEFEEGRDFLISEKKETRKIGGTLSIEYHLTVNMAKELSMVENNDIGKLARKYFIAIESAFKNRKEWNYDRADTLVGFKGLQQAFMKYRAELLPNVPDWARNNIQIAEFWAINDVIIGMTSNEFRNVMGLNKKESIRNAFTEQQLEYVALLEKFDADLIAIHNIFDFEERHKKLYEKYMLLSKGKFA